MRRDFSRILQALAIALFFLGNGYLGLRASSSGHPTTMPQGANKPHTSRIILEHADVLTYDAAYRRDVQRLIGSVRFRHETATMTCDSAYLNESDQTFEAFGQVHMIQGDTINIYADYLLYDGRTRLAKLRHNVKLENTTTTVFTDSLDYDRVTDVAYYFDGGTVTDAQNTLTSDYGQFQPRTNDAEFRYNVRLVNDTTEMTTEQLFYNTKTHIGRYLGESQIKSDSGVINSTRGMYDFDKQVGILLERSEVISGHRRLLGDSIYYDGQARFGEAFGNMELHDTVQKASLYGDYGYYNALRNYAFSTSRTYVADYSHKDTTYIGADTLELITYQRDMTPDTLGQVPTDSLLRELRAYHRVKVFRVDMQAIADSLASSSQDSILKLFGRPVMWHEQRQMIGDTTLVYFKNQKIDYIDLRSNVFIAEQMLDAKDYYNQLKGTNLRAFVQDSTIRQINVTDGPVESIFYMKEDKANEYTGMNRMQSKDMTVYLDSGQLKKVLWLGEVKAKVYPIEMSERDNANRLEGFVWEEARRPTSRLDVLSDSIGPTLDLASLSKYSGERRVSDIYTAYDKAREHRQAELDSLRSTLDTYDYQYILQAQPRTDDPTAERIHKLLSLSWLYNYSSNQEDQEHSSTNSSTQIPARKP